jgi:hypothetical protein
MTGRFFPSRYAIVSAPFVDNEDSRLSADSRKAFSAAMPYIAAQESSDASLTPP